MIGKHWNECRNFLVQARQENPQARIVVHCAAGRNRSGLIAAAALLLLTDERDYNGNTDTALDDTEQEQEHHQLRRGLLDVVRYLKKKRGIVLNNLSFQKQLCLLAAREIILEATSSPVV